jgi:hypothetical protein
LTRDSVSAQRHGTSLWENLKVLVGRETCAFLPDFLSLSLDSEDSFLCGWGLAMGWLIKVFSIIIPSTDMH